MRTLVLLIGIIFISFENCLCQLIEQNQIYTEFDTEKFEGKFKPQVTVLGTFHFTNSAIHDYNDEFKINSLTSQRQNELNIVLDKIAEFKPTKILVERNRINYDSLLNNQYLRYLNGEYRLKENDEVYQIAFRLGKQLKLKKIHCSDAKAEWFGVDLDWDNFNEVEYLKNRHQYKKSNRYGYEKSYRLEDSLKVELSLLDYFKFINSPKHQLFNHQIYLTESVLSGAGDNYLGADSVARWYRRNLRIFSNVLDIVNFDKEERILIIYGASHVWTLKQFFNDSPDFDYIEINKILE